MVTGEIEHKDSITFNISDQLFWEILKMKIRSVSIEYSSARAKKLKSESKLLEKEILDLENKVNASGKKEDIELLEEKKQSFQNSREKYIEGLMLRLKATWYEKRRKKHRLFLFRKKEFCK